MILFRFDQIRSIAETGRQKCYEVSEKNLTRLFIYKRNPGRIRVDALSRAFGMRSARRPSFLVGPFFSVACPRTIFSSTSGERSRLSASRRFRYHEERGKKRRWRISSLIARERFPRSHYLDRLAGFLSVLLFTLFLGCFEHVCSEDKYFQIFDKRTRVSVWI